MYSLSPLLVFLMGLAAGSFLSVVVDRMPTRESVIKGRSRCPDCRNTIAWYDNVPIVSFLLLRGKCRSCGKPISRFYPFIEIFTAFVFLAIYSLHSICQPSNLFCEWSNHLGAASLPFYFIIATVLIGIFVIDLRHQLIPDELSLSFFVIASFALIFAWTDTIYINAFVGFVSAGFLLLLHLITKGKGMGLGDVKLAIPMGMILGFPYAVVWMSLAFIIGAVVGVILLISGKTKFGKHIAFGPFLVIAFVIALFCTTKATNLLFPI